MDKFFPVLLTVGIILSISCTNDMFVGKYEIELFKQRWESQKITDYEYFINKSCFCVGGENIIVVKDSKVQAVLNPVTREPATFRYRDLEEDISYLETFPEAYHTIDDLYEALLWGEKKGAEIEFKANARTGIPIEIVINEKDFERDGGVRFEINSFKEN